MFVFKYFLGIRKKTLFLIIFDICLLQIHEFIHLFNFFLRTLYKTDKCIPN